MGQQFTTGLFMVVGVVLVFYIFGVVELGAESPNSLVLTLLIYPQSFQTSQFFAANIFQLLLTGGAVAGVILGLVSKNFELATMSAIIGAIGNLIFEVVIVYNALRSQNEIIALLFFSPVILWLGFLLIDYWRGRD